MSKKMTKKTSTRGGNSKSPPDPSAPQKSRSFRRRKLYRPLDPHRTPPAYKPPSMQPTVVDGNHTLAIVQPESEKKD